MIICRDPETRKRKCIIESIHSGCANTEPSQLQTLHTAEKLVKFTSDGRLFPELRKDLNLLGFNASSMLPDLDGLCEHLEGRFIWADDEL